MKRKEFSRINYNAVMHPDDKRTIDWLNGLQVPYYSLKEFIREMIKHPKDKLLKEWLEILKAGKDYYTFKDFLRITTSKYREAYNEVEYQGEGINITNKSLPQMYRQLVEACEILGIKEVPTYSTNWFYAPYHSSNGETHRRIIMVSGSVDLFTKDEMMFTLGHELGHIVCGHKPYHMLLETFYMPFINDAAFKAWGAIIKLPLLEWYRTSDYTADRVGLLCCQDINAALSTMIKKAGLPKKCYHHIDIESFIQQAKNFDENFTSTMDKAVKALSIRSAEFPWLVVRAKNLLDWYNSSGYKQIIDKNLRSL
ncbi:MAG: M48 family metallopeptidase [Bacteroidaceae bacterium]|nr:M48 family metallopeptidase [Bacteroidaceae bacterium]